MHSANSIIHRLDPLGKEKDKCDKFEYDYVITERKVENLICFLMPILRL